eukprot:CAMPEP_0181116562 /NCGR_PEP_ID=MMETSP1071-20121207/22023_1 /TAXON_ID=35127 /ORGANISM="Thalassiosira sp., Strain NH16" /LENGTH=558 /DNA_ID=CAMNT_0023200827 /DNA_START=163 /DNA_END=1839 /DNA_ORIENTATION=-
MSFQGRSLDEREAASIVAGLHSTNNTAARSRSRDGSSKKRGRDTFNAVSVEYQSKKKAKASAVKPKATAAAAARKEPPMDATGLVFAQPELKPAPYFYYTDHSLEQDDDPLTPIAAAGSVPTFPAKMHAILTNPELADVVGWAPHGRSWRILKPRDFEIRVLPKYFEHSKFSSFVRQANGWGFRRMSQGYDKNAYYHEYFLRAMPWLCKKMRRPKVAEKKAVDSEMEPDFDAISRQLPVVDRPPTREVLVLQKTIELGPKARMPVLWDTGTPPAPSSPVRMPVEPVVVQNIPEVENFPALNNSRSYGDLKPAALPTNPPPPTVPVPPDAAPVAANVLLNMGNPTQAQVQQFSENSMLPPNTMPATSNHQHALNPAFTYAATTAAAPGIPQNIPPSIPPSASSGNLASDSHFAAGFMAATAFHSSQIRSMLSTAFAAGMPIPEAASMIMPPVAAAAAPPAATANLGSALDLLQRAGIGHQMQMAQNNLHHHHHQHQVANPAPAVVTGGTNIGFHGAANSVVGSQPSSLSGHAMQRLQQFQAYQSSRGDTHQLPYHQGNP